MTDAPFEPLTEEESVELAVLLDNLEELLRLHDMGMNHTGSTADIRVKLRKWVDRLCE